MKSLPPPIYDEFSIRMNDAASRIGTALMIIFSLSPEAVERLADAMTVIQNDVLHRNEEDAAAAGEYEGS